MAYTNDALPAAVTQKLETLPDSPGVYVFHGQGEVLYVGKAGNLRSRVRSYFQRGTSDARAFVARLDRELRDIETFVTASPKEAALLENQLIKKVQPRYNIKLRDDKEFLSLRLRENAPWPRLEVVRRPKKDTARYFGPYHSATAARQTLRLVNRHFQLRTCTDTEFRSRVRPCLQYQIRRCPGPCVLEVDRDAYAQQVRDVALFLDGRHDELVRLLGERMHGAAERLDYEQAGVHRDQLRAVERVMQSQRVAQASGVDQDVVGLYRQADQAEIAVLQVRGGRLVGVRTFALKDISLPDDEVVASFLAEWFARAPVPDEVLLPMPIEAMEGLAEALTEADPTRSRDDAESPTSDKPTRPRRRVKVSAPQRGKRKALLELALENAEHAFNEKRRAHEDVERRLGEVQKRLRLPRVPTRIECIDISHTGGDETVAAIVALRDGKPDRKRYRTYHVRTVKGGDDYGAMYEVLSRRLKRGREKQEGWELPDLLVVDGGKGQLNVALAALADLGVTDLPVAALAKEKENPLGEKRVDRVYLPGQKNPIAVHSTPALAMLCLARDEAHRSSNALRTKVGTKKRLTSGLDAVPGIGPKTRARLLTALGSLDAVRDATVDERIAAGATRKQAQAIDAFFTRSAGSAEEHEQVAVENAFAELL